LIYRRAVSPVCHPALTAICSPEQFVYLDELLSWTNDNSPKLSLFLMGIKRALESCRWKSSGASAIARALEAVRSFLLDYSLGQA
jgi:hypothetical protein